MYLAGCVSYRKRAWIRSYQLVTAMTTNGSWKQGGSLATEHARGHREKSGRRQRSERLGASEKSCQGASGGGRGGSAGDRAADRDASEAGGENLWKVRCINATDGKGRNGELAGDLL